MGGGGKGSTVATGTFSRTVSGIPGIMALILQHLNMQHSHININSLFTWNGYKLVLMNSSTSFTLATIIGVSTTLD